MQQAIQVNHLLQEIPVLKILMNWIEPEGFLKGQQQVVQQPEYQQVHVQLMLQQLEPQLQEMLGDKFKATGVKDLNLIVEMGKRQEVQQALELQLQDQLRIEVHKQEVQRHQDLQRPVQARTEAHR